MEDLIKYAVNMNAPDDVLKWITVHLKNQSQVLHNISDMEHTIDYLCSDAAPKRLSRMSYADALKNAVAWSNANQKKGRNIIDREDDIEPVLQLKDGTSIVKLKSKNAYKREGFLMRHCLGAYAVKNEIEIYSYRDVKNMPHATFEVKRNLKEVIQIKGKGNGPIHPKYVEPVLEFLEFLNIKVRPMDMKNLGYHHIEEKHLPMVMLIEGADTQIVGVRGEKYAV